MSDESLREKYKLFISCNDYIVSYYLGVANLVDKIERDSLLCYPAYLLLCNYYISWLNGVDILFGSKSVVINQIAIDKIGDYESRTLSNDKEEFFNLFEIKKEAFQFVAKKFRKIKRIYSAYRASNGINCRKLDAKAVEFNVNLFVNTLNDFIDSSLKIYYSIVEKRLKNWYIEAKKLNAFELLESYNQDYQKYFGKQIDDR